MEQTNELNCNSPENLHLIRGHPGCVHRAAVDKIIKNDYETVIWMGNRSVDDLKIVRRNKSALNFNVSKLLNRIQIKKLDVNSISEILRIINFKEDGESTSKVLLIDGLARMLRENYKSEVLIHEDRSSYKKMLVKQANSELMEEKKKLQDKFDSKDQEKKVLANEQFTVMRQQKVNEIVERVNKLTRDKKEYKNSNSLFQRLEILDKYEDAHVEEEIISQLKSLLEKLSKFTNNSEPLVFVLMEMSMNYRIEDNRGNIKNFSWGKKYQTEIDNLFMDLSDEMSEKHENVLIEDVTTSINDFYQLEKYTNNTKEIVKLHYFRE